jgi:hypothetical protein
LIIVFIITNFVMFLFVSFYFILTRTSTIWLSSCLHSLWLWLHCTCTSQLCQVKVFWLDVFGFCISFLFFCRFFSLLVGVIVWLEVVFSFHRAYVVLAFCHVDVEFTLCCAHVMFAFHNLGKTHNPNFKT